MYQFSVLEVSGWRTGASDANTLPTAPHAAGEWQPYSDRLSRGRAQGAAADGPRGAELVKAKLASRGGGLLSGLHGGGWVPVSPLSQFSAGQVVVWRQTTPV